MNYMSRNNRRPFPWLDLLALAGVWVFVVVGLGFLGKVTWALLKFGWGLAPW
jgi:hypothetical protein